MLCNYNLKILPVGPRCSERRSSYTPAIVIYSSWVLRGTNLAKCQVNWVVVSDMHGTHCKHNSWVSLSVSKNNLALLRCGYMCDGTLVYIPRHLSKTSDNNKRCQLIIRCMFCNSSRINLVYDDVRYMVYDEGFLVWIIPSTYLCYEVINWVCTAGFPIFTVIGFYFRFLLLLLLLLHYICLHPGLPLVFYSTSLLLLSYYIMYVLCLISFTISLQR